MEDFLPSPLALNCFENSSTTCILIKKIKNNKSLISFFLATIIKYIYLTKVVIVYIHEMYHYLSIILWVEVLCCYSKYLELFRVVVFKSPNTASHPFPLLLQFKITPTPTPTFTHVLRISLNGHSFVDCTLGN